MKLTRNTARLLSAVLAFVMVLALATPASAEKDAVSVELVMNADGLEISGKLAASSEGVLSLGAKMLLGGESATDLTVYASMAALAVESSFLDKAYGVELATLAENLKSSVFAPDSGSQFALSEEDFNTIQNLLSADLTQEIPGMSALSGLDYEALANAYCVVADALSQAAEQITDKLALESAPATVTVNGEAISVTQVRVTVSTEAMIALSDALLTSLETSAELQDAVNEIANAISVINGEPLSEPVVPSLLENLDEVRQTVRDDLTNSAPSVTVTGCSAESGAIVKLALDITISSESISATLLKSEAADFYRLEMVDADSTVTALQFELTESSDAALGFHFGSYEGDTETGGVIFRLDKTAQTFETTVISTFTSGETGEITTYTNSVSGYYALTDTLFALTFDKVDGQELGFTVTLNVRSDDTVTMPTFAELTKLSEEELAAAMDALVSGISVLTQMFGGSVQPAA